MCRSKDDLSRVFFSIWLEVMDFTVVVCTSIPLSFLVDRGLNVCVYRSCGFIHLDIGFYFLPRALIVKTL